MTRRCGVSMKLDWYFVGPLVVIRMATPSAARATLTDDTCTLVSVICAVPMPAVMATRSSSTPTIGTMGFIRQSPLPRISIRISVQDQAQGHCRRALTRLRRDSKGHCRRGDANHPSVAKTVSVLEDVADAIRSLDKGQGALRAAHDSHQLGRGHIDAPALAGK